MSIVSIVSIVSLCIYLCMCAYGVCESGEEVCVCVDVCEWGGEGRSGLQVRPPPLPPSPPRGNE